MSQVPVSYNIAKLSSASIEYKILRPQEKFNGTTIVLLYGLVCNNRHWEFQLEYFLNNGFQILLHNYRFHFGSYAYEQNIEENLTFKKIAMDLEELLDHLEIDNIFLVGHSMGVNISLEFIKNSKKNIFGQVLISGNPLDPKDTMFNTDKSHEVIPLLKKSLQNNPKLFKFIWKNAHKVNFVRKIVLYGGFNPDQVKDEFVEFYLKKIGELEPEVFFQLIKEMAEQSLLTSLPFVKISTLIMGGDHDTIAPISSQLIFKNLIDHSEFYIIKDGSHVPQADFYSTVNQKIHQFILSKI